MSHISDNASPAFITGSRAYGTPRDDSDVDLVVLVDESTRDLLVSLGSGGKTFPHGNARVYFGKLNLILVTCEEDYEAWSDGTWQLWDRKPVERAEAVELFTSLGLTNPVSTPT